MTQFADLHIHTNYSDSTFSPQDVVDEASKNNLCCISITDHDTVDGVRPTYLLAQSVGMEVISGLELSCEFEGKDIHMLGYCIDCEDGLLREQLSRVQAVRVQRIKDMIQKLKECGIDNIEFEEVSRLTCSDAIGRMHLATVLKKKKKVSSIQEAFQKYIGEGRPAYVPKFKQTPFEAISFIRKCGGVAVLAHPQLTNRDELIPALAEAGLKGIEVYYPTHSPSTVKYYQELAEQHKLIMTGGSDSHGKARESTFIGKSRVDYGVVQKLKEESRRG